MGLHRIDVIALVIVYFVAFAHLLLLSPGLGLLACNPAEFNYVFTRLFLDNIGQLIHHEHFLLNVLCIAFDELFCAVSNLQQKAGSALAGRQIGLQLLNFDAVYNGGHLGYVCEFPVQFKLVWVGRLLLNREVAPRVWGPLGLWSPLYHSFEVRLRLL